MLIPREMKAVKTREQQSEQRQEFSLLQLRENESLFLSVRETERSENFTDTFKLLFLSFGTSISLETELTDRECLHNGGGSLSILDNINLITLFTTINILQSTCRMK